MPLPTTSGISKALTPSIANSIFKTAFRVAFEISPIIMVNGIAEKIPGKMLPIAVLTEHIGLVDGLLSGDFEFENSTTRFMPMPGGTLIAQDVASYPFLNQVVAANATIQKPNVFAMKMLRPATSATNTYTNKVIGFAALKAAMDEHHRQGGTYTVMTPSFIYTNCLLRSLIDISSFSDQNKQVQFEWMFEFEQPLLQEEDLNAVLSDVLSTIDGEKKSNNLAWSSITSKVKNIFGVG